MYQKTLSGWQKHWDFILLDVYCLIISLDLAYMIRHQTMNPFRMFKMTLYRDMAIVLFLVDLVLVLTLETFQDVLRRGYYVELFKTVKHDLIITACSLFYLFCLKDGNEYSRIVMFLTLGIYTFTSYVVRAFWKRNLRRRRNEHLTEGRSRMIIISTMRQAESVILNVESRNFGDYDIDGIVVIDKDMSGGDILGIPVLCNLSDFNESILNEWVDEILIASDDTGNVPKEQIQELIDMGLTVHQKLSIDIENEGCRKSLERVAGYSCITSCINVMSLSHRIEKRVLDICGGLVGCFITGILVVIIGPLIYKESPGPIFFKQERIGKNGKKFNIYKFRSMYMDAEARKAELMAQNELDSDLMFKMEDDPRIIGGKHGIGGIIRRFSLDEFPQFYNVLIGEMSLVGTRPPTLDEWEQYEAHHRARMATNPGITGMWQTSGRSGITDFEEVVRLDTEYIENWSLGLDLRLLVRTVTQVIQGEGAA